MYGAVRKSCQKVACKPVVANDVFGIELLSSCEAVWNWQIEWVILSTAVNSDVNPKLSWIF